MASAVSADPDDRQSLSTFRTMGGTLAGVVIGYSAATRTDPVVQSGLFNISVLVPALGFALLAAILWFWYPLHKKQVNENVIALKAKHENEKN